MSFDSLKLALQINSNNVVLIASADLNIGGGALWCSVVELCNNDCQWVRMMSRHCRTLYCEESSVSVNFIDLVFPLCRTKCV